MDEWMDRLKDVQRAGQVDKERTYEEMDEWAGRPIQGWRDVQTDEQTKMNRTGRQTF